MDLNSFISTILDAVIGNIATIISIVFGGILTLIVARRYYIRASQELSVEANKLRQLNNLILVALEQSNLATLTHDAEGNVTGVIGKLEGSVRIKFHNAGKLTDANNNN
jgi:hypothetical protein